MSLLHKKPTPKDAFYNDIAMAPSLLSTAMDAKSYEVDKEGNVLHMINANECARREMT
jgi:hypothetical protein